jgi:predicted nucleic acid-binding protein
MIRLELWRGVRGGDERKILELMETRVSMLEIGGAVWELAVQLMTKARSLGLTAPSADVLIVATAQYHNARLEHCDKHMEQLISIV